MKNNELFRASGIMAIGTILSRITGFFRAILGVAVLGTALLADTYNVANTTPNILYNLLVGGALTAIFVPQLVRSFQDEDGGDGFASRLVTTISGILLLLVLVGIQIGIRVRVGLLRLFRCLGSLGHHNWRAVEIDTIAD